MDECVLSIQYYYYYYYVVRLSRKLENSRTVDLYHGVRYGVSARFSFRPGVFAAAVAGPVTPKVGRFPPTTTAGQGEGATERRRRRRPVPIARVCEACERAPRVCARSRVYAAVTDVLRDALANRRLQYHSAATIILYTSAPRLTSVRLT